MGIGIIYLLKFNKMKNLTLYTIWLICFALSTGFCLAQTPIPPQQVEQEEDGCIYIMETHPEPKGGMPAFYKYVTENMKYPEEARKAGIEGKVFVQFTITKDGSLTDIKVLRGIGYGCDEEAIRVLQNAEKWNPGTQRGRPVHSNITIPVLFKLNETDIMEIPKEEIFVIVENMPEPKEGMQTFYEYIGKNLKYPEEARKAGIEGKVFVQFTVTKDGSLTDIKVLKGIGHGCDEEAIKVLQNAEKWKPGAQRGKVVNVRMSLPIVFKLGDVKEVANEEEIEVEIEEVAVNASPLIVLDGIISSNEALKSLDPKSIESIDVLKGETALEKYGNKGKYGVILIYTKKGVQAATIEIPNTDAYKINLYPNPSKKIVNIDLEIPQNEKVQITAHNQRTGKKQIILEQNYKAGTQTFAWEVSHLEVGTYILQIMMGDTLTYRRVVIEK